MSKRPPKRRPTTRRARPPRSRAEPELTSVLQALLAEDHPLPFLAQASGFAELLGEPGDPEAPDAGGFFSALLADGSPPALALAAVLDVLLPDRIARPRMPRGPLAAPWIALDEAQPTRAVIMIDPLGDATDVAVEVRLAGGPVLTLVVLADHDLGSAATDAFVIPDGLDGLLAHWRAVAEPGIVLQELPLSRAGSMLRMAEEQSHLVLGAPESDSDSWPMSRPLLRWVGRLLPAGAPEWQPQEWSDDDLERLAGEIVGGTEPAALGPDALDVVQTVLSYAAGRALGDPLRWSPGSTERFLAWLPGHVIADAAWYAQVPSSLRAVVRYAHPRRNVLPGSTDVVLLGVDGWEAAHGGDRLELAALRRRFEEYDPEHLLAPRPRLRRLALEAGGDDALRALDAEPLPEPDDSGLPEDVRQRVAELVDVIRHVVERCFDGYDELTVAATTLLVRVAAADPVAFRRSRSDPRTTAAAATWVVAKANDAFSDGPLVRELVAGFGLTSNPSQRATGLLKTVGLEWLGPSRSLLGDVGLLTSRRRAAMIAGRDESLAALGED